MCGIAGIVSGGGEALDLQAPLRAMQAALRHRGPDDQGRFVSADNRAGFVHTRLAILDPTPAGHQPMSTPDARLTIVLNGEIYNFEDLRQELMAQGATFHSHSDTEVVLRLYERVGPDCVRRLEGMYAFAIWDARDASCFLARDPLGIKPLYLARSASRLLFASELRALLASGLAERRLDPVGVLGYLETGSVPEPGTLVEGIEMLGAGSWLLWSGAGSTSRTWWQPRIPPPGEPSGDPPGAVREALLGSLRRHFVSDVPVGAFLSGGIDSTAVVALSRLVGQRELRTFSIRFADPRFDEGEIARRTAEHFGTCHRERLVDAATGRRLLDRFLSHLDQPSIDGFNTFTVANFASEEGMKVVVSGLGGDELFGGYPSFRQVPRIYRWSRWLGMLPAARTAAGELLRHSRRPQARRLRGLLKRPASVAAAHRAFRGIFPAEEAHALAARITGRPAKSFAAPWTELPAQPTLRDTVSVLELERYMRNQLLRDSDVMSMAWGLELRVPFVDCSLFEAVVRIPAKVRLRSGKQLLVDAVPEIPDWVTGRPKRGFLFPFQHWLDGEWRELVDGAVRRSGVRAETWYQKWSLFVLENWRAANGVGEA